MCEYLLPTKEMFPVVTPAVVKSLPLEIQYIFKLDCSLFLFLRLFWIFCMCMGKYLLFSFVTSLYLISAAIFYHRDGIINISFLPAGIIWLLAHLQHVLSYLWIRSVIFNFRIVHTGQCSDRYFLLIPKECENFIIFHGNGFTHYSLQWSNNQQLRRY